MRCLYLVFALNQIEITSCEGRDKISLYWQRQMINLAEIKAAVIAASKAKKTRRKRYLATRRDIGGCSRQTQLEPTTDSKSSCIGNDGEIDSSIVLIDADWRIMENSIARVIVGDKIRKIRKSKLATFWTHLSSKRWQISESPALILQQRKGTGKREEREMDRRGFQD